VSIKIRVCQIIGPAAAGSAGPVPTALNHISQGSVATCLGCDAVSNELQTYCRAYRWKCFRNVWNM